ncbi:MAG TPA: glycosyl transferase family 2, partial [Rikenellaceae bacterium]|nr:glycosyl transferase family 2 [Rikenellaceae bacterium]
MRVSFILPVYKVEKYLAECVRSLLAQTYDDFEIILI